jgi:hypothetical protein
MAAPAPIAPAFTLQAPQPAKRITQPPRRQFNMSPEAMKMLDELLDHVRAYSSERDTRASEIFHALVLAVHEVKPYLDLSGVPPRGRWGSESAANFPVALKEAFQDAIARTRRR